MKRTVMLLATVALFICMSINIYAKEYNGSSESENDHYRYEDYLPKEILDILSKNGGQAPKDIDVSYILRASSEYIYEAVMELSAPISELVLIILVFAIIKRIIDNCTVVTIIDWVFLLLLARVMYLIFTILHSEISATLESLSEILTVILPTFTTLLLMGGAPVTAGTATVSFGATAICLETVLSELGLTLAVLTFIFMIFERLSPVFENISCVKYLKKYTVMLITFVCTVLMTVLSFQTVLSARTDSVSTRSVKFAAANFIPIVGNAVGESLRTVSYGVDYLKTTVSGAVSVAIFFTLFPVLAKLIVVKLFVSLGCFFASACGVGGGKSILDAFVEVIDILLVIIICSVILSILIVILFASSFTIS